MIDIFILDDSGQSGAETNYQNEDKIIKNVSIWVIPSSKLQTNWETLPQKKEQSHSMYSMKVRCTETPWLLVSVCLFRFLYDRRSFRKQPPREFKRKVVSELSWAKTIKQAFPSSISGLEFWGRWRVTQISMAVQGKQKCLLIKAFCHLSVGTFHNNRLYYVLVQREIFQTSLTEGELKDNMLEGKWDEYNIFRRTKKLTTSQMCRVTMSCLLSWYLFKVANNISDITRAFNSKLSYSVSFFFHP